MQNQHKTGLVLIIGILMGAVLVLFFVVFFGNNVAVLPMEKQQKTYNANNQQKNKQQTAKRQNKTYIYRLINIVNLLIINQPKINKEQ